MNDEVAIHPLLRDRWSPLAWDSSHELTEPEVATLLEASRWSPSAGNSQPWSFIVGRRGDAAHQRIVRHLAASSARWAPDASVLVVNLCHATVEDTDWEYSEFAQYDLGQAVAHLTIQARAMGLATRQFAAFDSRSVAAEFTVADHWVVTTMTAVGRPGEEPPTRRRERREREDLLWRPRPSSTAPPSPSAS